MAWRISYPNSTTPIFGLLVVGLNPFVDIFQSTYAVFIVFLKKFMWFFLYLLSNAGAVCKTVDAYVL